jgi:hypothetical protein
MPRGQPTQESMERMARHEKQMERERVGAAAHRGSHKAAAGRRPQRLAASQRPAERTHTPRPLSGLRQTGRRG